MPTIRVQGPNGRTFSVQVCEGETIIGRDGKAGLLLDDLRVSRRHAALRRERTAVTVCDLQSRNGTYHNGVRLAEQPAPLAPGDVIKVGDYTLVFDLDDAQQFAQESSMRPVLQKAPVDLLLSRAVPPPPGREPSPEGLRFELEKKVKVLGLFYELSRTLGSVFSLPDVYDKAMALLLQVTPSARVVIFQRDGSGEMRQVAARTRVPLKGAPEGATEPIKVSRTVFDNVARQRVSVLLEATGANVEAVPDSVRLHQAQSVMAAPILGRRGLLGVIYADQQDVGQTFSSDDLDLLNAVAVQTGIAIDTVHAHDALQREAQAREKYERFLPQQIVDDVMLDPSKEVRPGGRRQVVTALFADLRGFTTLAEEQTPETVVDLLNRFFTLMSEVIFKHHGTLDKYIGDGVLALFGAPYASERDAARAVRAAIDMQRAVKAFNVELAAAGEPTIGVGVGIHSGPAIVGFIGSESRLDYTAVGDTINTAARLEHMARPGQIIISENTIQQLDAGVSYRMLDAVQVKGRATKLQIADVVWDVGPR